MKHVIRGTLAVIALAAFSIGCGGDDAPSEPPSGVLVEYQRGGGLAGVLEELRIQRDGSATLIVGPDRERTTFELDDAQLEQLESDLDAADLTDPEEPPGDPVCADCFGYRIEYEGQEATWDSITRPSVSLQDVASDLDEIVADHHPPD